MFDNHKEVLSTLKYMLSSLLDRQDVFAQDTENSEVFEQGVRALRAAIDAVENQIYA